MLLKYAITICNYDIEYDTHDHIRPILCNDEFNAPSDELLLEAL